MRAGGVRRPEAPRREHGQPTAARRRALGRPRLGRRSPRAARAPAAAARSPARADPRGTASRRRRRTRRWRAPPATCPGDGRRRPGPVAGRAASVAGARPSASRPRAGCSRSTRRTRTGRPRPARASRSRLLGRGAGIDQTRQRRGVGRDDEVVGQPALESEARHAERLVLVGAGAIGEARTRIRRCPTARRAGAAVFDLPPDARAAALIEQRAGKAAHQQQRHQVLEHRAAPRHQRRAAVDVRHEASEMEPVVLRHVAFGDGDEAGQPRLRRQQVVERAVERVPGRPRRRAGIRSRRCAGGGRRGSRTASRRRAPTHAGRAPAVPPLSRRPTRTASATAAIASSNGPDPEGDVVEQVGGRGRRDRSASSRPAALERLRSPPCRRALSAPARR